ncbi:SAM-dependent methyltransferase [Floricoccus penangensis]|uniref:SAM-dependent methyltransferase n=1 Tax=Floricoccus penangensis TaxID=1859475 RepID=A0A9Q5JEU4_9LACT|nr:class I SAM-dependent methyltransferase [Floricoccus penangensis]OFI45922.1 SAM-dependent methyltransferase [Floricoccus penangensis]
MLSPLKMAHYWLKEIIEPDDIVIDATMGNGFDTIFLAQLTKKVYSFDVQEAAIVSTQEKLVENKLEGQLILDGHENVDKYVDKVVKAAIFNLGYLPKSDKSIITKASTTLVALRKILTMMEKSSRLAIMVYYGHEGGSEEKVSVENFVENLEQKEYQVMKYGAMNQKNTPPFLIMIEKLK